MRKVVLESMHFINTHLEGKQRKPNLKKQKLFDLIFMVRKMLKSTLIGR